MSGTVTEPRGKPQGSEVDGYTTAPSVAQPRKRVKRLMWHATREHRLARERNPQGWFEWWAAIYYDAGGQRHVAGKFQAYDAREARQSAEYHLSRYPAPWQREAYAAWHRSGELVERLPREIARAA